MEEGGRENRGLIMGVFWSCDFQSDRLILVISPSAELDFMDYLVSTASVLASLTSC